MLSQAAVCMLASWVRALRALTSMTSNRCNFAALCTLFARNWWRTADVHRRLLQGVENSNDEWAINDTNRPGTNAPGASEHEKQSVKGVH
ncbi:hypothetical protein LZ30DRAFT_723817 [Colletotrichum cereale]|nr:hypothetical protein LZ30DRAFT_723817 [Colletotrichum cereale]